MHQLIGIGFVSTFWTLETVLKSCLFQGAFDYYFIGLFQCFMDMVEMYHWRPTVIRRMLLKYKIMGAWEMAQWVRVPAV